MITLVFSLPVSLHSSPNRGEIILATTTSTQDSGLLDVLIPLFERKTGYFVKTIAVGSGQALALGRRGEADVLLVHAPEDERAFVAAGFGIHRRSVMYNDFIIVGPPSDPAGINGVRSAVDAFRKIACARAPFLSRGDNSGTHGKEKAVWSLAGIKVEGEQWYQETGLGMGETLTVASEKKAYTLTDRGSYLALKRRLNLIILSEGDRALKNVYHVIEVNPERWPHVKAKGARAFAEFIVSQEAQHIIKNFGVERFGTPLFFPLAK